MKNPSLPIVFAVALLVLGYMAGVVATNSGGANAHASPHWDAARGAYVTGDATSLTFWKVKDGKVLEAMTYQTNGGTIKESTHRSGAMPPAAPARPAGSKDGTSCGSCGGGGSCG